MTIIAKNYAYNFRKMETEGALLFTWNHVPGLDIALFKTAILEFAQLCAELMPRKGIIDATALDQNSAAVGWLRGQPSAEEVSYDDWWLSEIVPKYNAAQMAGLAVATGDPSAPGALPHLPEAVSFKVGYFPDMKASLGWQP